MYINQLVSLLSFNSKISRHHSSTEKRYNNRDCRPINVLPNQYIIFENILYDQVSSFFGKLDRKIFKNY